jgi:RNA polymerase sigma-70 factor (ECF subfamily)
MASWESLAAVAGGEELAGVLRELYQAGRTRWSALPPLPPEDFVAHVAIHLPPDVDRAAHLRGLAAEDLYLACACAQGLPGAAAVFDTELVSRVPGYIARIDRSPAFADEITQVVRERLLVRRDGAPPRIADYAGRGALASWLRVIAVRAALDRRPADDDDDDCAALDQLAADTAPELAVLRTRHAAAMTAALRDAVAALTPEQRVILRMYFASGQSTEQIAAVLRVNRSTAARRLVAARQAVFDETHRRLRAELPLTTDEFASLARALHDQLDVSLSGLLGER